MTRNSDIQMIMCDDDALRSLYARANKKNNKQCDKGALYVMVLITKSSWAEMRQIK